MTDAELEALMRATGTEGYPSDVRRLVEAVQAAERERCAKLCEDIARRNWHRWDQEANPQDQGAAIAADELADAIRD